MQDCADCRHRRRRQTPAFGARPQAGRPKDRDLPGGRALARAARRPAVAGPGAVALEARAPTPRPPLGEEIPDPDPDFTIDTGAGELPLDLDTATFSEATEHARHLRSGTAASGMAADGDDCLSNYIPPVATIVKSDGTVDFPQSNSDIDITELQIDNEIPDPLPKPDPEVADPGFGASFPEFTEIPDPGYLAAENANDAEVPDNTGASTSAASTFILPDATHRHTTVDDTDEGSGTSESSSDDDDTVTRRTPINLRSRKKQPEYADDDPDFEDAEIATEEKDSESE